MRIVTVTGGATIIRLTNTSTDRSEGIDNCFVSELPPDVDTSDSHEYPDNDCAMNSYNEGSIEIEEIDDMGVEENENQDDVPLPEEITPCSSNNICIICCRELKVCQCRIKRPF